MREEDQIFKDADLSPRVVKSARKKSKVIGS